jgi:UDP-N-acetylmuramoylalanine--D-glutamate ligase
VSSFQAERLGQFCADSLLWTNFAEDHLERHGSMESYFTAKWELVLRTPSGRFFVGSSVQRYAAQFGRPLPEAACVATEGQPEDPRLLGDLVRLLSAA